MSKRLPLSITTGVDDVASNATICVESMSLHSDSTSIFMAPGSVNTTSFESPNKSDQALESPSVKPFYSGHNARTPQQHTSYGIVKWFDPNKGFGFISLLPGQPVFVPDVSALRAKSVFNFLLKTMVIKKTDPVAVPILPLDSTMGRVTDMNATLAGDSSLSRRLQLFTFDHDSSTTLRTCPMPSTAFDATPTGTLIGPLVCPTQWHLHTRFQQSQESAPPTPATPAGAFSFPADKPTPIKLGHTQSSSSGGTPTPTAFLSPSSSSSSSTPGTPGYCPLLCEDVFVHQSRLHCNGFRRLVEGQLVEFELTYCGGRSVARAVTGLGNTLINGEDATAVIRAAGSAEAAAAANIPYDIVLEALTPPADNKAVGKQAGLPVENDECVTGAAEDVDSEEESGETGKKRRRRRKKKRKKKSGEGDGECGGDGCDGNDGDDSSLSQPPTALTTDSNTNAASASISGSGSSAPAITNTSTGTANTNPRNATLAATTTATNTRAMARNTSDAAVTDATTSIPRTRGDPANDPRKRGGGVSITSTCTISTSTSTSTSAATSVSTSGSTASGADTSAGRQATQPTAAQNDRSRRDRDRDRERAKDREKAREEDKEREKDKDKERVKAETVRDKAIHSDTIAGNDSNRERDKLDIERPRTRRRDRERGRGIEANTNTNEHVDPREPSPDANPVAANATAARIAALNRAYHQHCTLSSAQPMITYPTSSPGIPQDLPAAVASMAMPLASFNSFTSANSSYIPTQSVAQSATGPAYSLIAAAPNPTPIALDLRRSSILSLSPPPTIVTETRSEKHRGKGNVAYDVVYGPRASSPRRRNRRNKRDKDVNSAMSVCESSASLGTSHTTHTQTTTTTTTRTSASGKPQPTSLTKSSSAHTSQTSQVSREKQQLQTSLPPPDALCVMPLSTCVQLPLAVDEETQAASGRTPQHNRRHSDAGITPTAQRQFWAREAQDCGKGARCCEPAVREDEDADEAVGIVLLKTSSAHVLSGPSYPTSAVAGAPTAFLPPNASHQPPQQQQKKLQAYVSLPQTRTNAEHNNTATAFPQTTQTCTAVHPQHLPPTAAEQPPRWQPSSQPQQQHPQQQPYQHQQPPLPPQQQQQQWWPSTPSDPSPEASTPSLYPPSQSHASSSQTYAGSSHTHTSSSQAHTGMALPSSGTSSQSSQQLGQQLGQQRGQQLQLQGGLTNGQYAPYHHPQQQHNHHPPTQQQQQQQQQQQSFAHAHAQHSQSVSAPTYHTQSLSTPSYHPPQVHIQHQHPSLVSQPAHTAQHQHQGMAPQQHLQPHQHTHTQQQQQHPHHQQQQSHQHLQHQQQHQHAFSHQQDLFTSNGHSQQQHQHQQQQQYHYQQQYLSQPSQPQQHQQLQQQHVSPMLQVKQSQIHHHPSPYHSPYIGPQHLSHVASTITHSTALPHAHTPASHPTSLSLAPTHYSNGAHASVSHTNTSTPLLQPSIHAPHTTHTGPMHAQLSNSTPLGFTRHVGDSFEHATRRNDPYDPYNSPFGLSTNTNVALGVNLGPNMGPGMNMRGNEANITGNNVLTPPIGVSGRPMSLNTPSLSTLDALAPPYLPHTRSDVYMYPQQDAPHQHQQQQQHQHGHSQFLQPPRSTQHNTLPTTHPISSSLAHVANTPNITPQLRNTSILPHSSAYGLNVTGLQASTHHTSTLSTMSSEARPTGINANITNTGLATATPATSLSLANALFDVGTTSVPQPEFNNFTPTWGTGNQRLW